jgi:hypothetical protein
MAKTKVNFDEKEAIKRFKMRFEEFRKKDQWKDEAAKLAINKLKGETRLGRFLATGENQPPLSPGWIKRRKELAQHNTTGTSFREGKSNLTLTGQLIDSIKRFPDATRVIIETMGERIPYRNKNGTSAKKTPTNAELVGYLEERGRRLLGVDQKTIGQIKKKLMEFIRRNLLR